MGYFVTADERSHHNIFPGVDLYTVAGDQLMISIVEMQPGAVVEKHSHPHEQMGILLEGELDFTVGEETRLLKPGDMWRIPGDVSHYVVAGKEGAKALDLFHPVRDDYR